jgi:hypothetical protein
MTPAEQAVLGFVYKECDGDVNPNKYIGNKVWDIATATGLDDVDTRKACDSLIKRGALEWGTMARVRLTLAGKLAWEAS